ncbi:MAG: hypothetical protein ATN32_07320 [Candidatus Epulonipiscium fishelsonii]|nr:MAG: hypothetical protein ATN32_07320 [Epulopiscium sp. AS2M-Bin002]
MTVSAEIGPTADNIGFIIRKSIEGNDWAEKDTDGDRFIRIPLDQTITNIQVTQGQIEFEMEK